MANIRDFAVGLVLTAPSPKNSGTTLTLRAGEGGTMPTPPFYVTATPPGQLTSIGTSEKLLVTNVSGDTLTITRAQSPTTAKNIDTNWTVANAMYVDDVYQSNIVVDEKLTGTINGTNKVFTTASAFTSIQVYKNGVAMHKTDDFTVTGYNQITFVTAPATGANLIATYITGSQIMINGSNSLISDETPTGTVNGTNKVFTTLRPYIANSLQVFINGIRQKSTTHFVETNPSLGTFTMDDAPLTGDNIMVSYQFVQSVSGNADTVDGYHYYDAAPIGAGMDYWAETLPSANWMFAYGQAISRTTYAALFSLFGTTYGSGDGSTTFNLPDKRGRVSAALDNMGGTTAGRLNSPATGGITATTLGATGGEQKHTQTVSEMPSHNHNWRSGNGQANSGSQYQTAINNAGYDTYAPTDYTGGGNAMNITQPTIICNYIIKVA